MGCDTFALKYLCWLYWRLSWTRRLNFPYSWCPLALGSDFSLFARGSSETWVSPCCSVVSLKDLTLCPWRLCCQGRCTQCYRTAFSAQGSSYHMEQWRCKAELIYSFLGFSMSGCIQDGFPLLMLNCRPPPECPNISIPCFFPSAGCQSLQISAQLLIFYSTLEATSFVGWHFFISPFLFLRNSYRLCTSLLVLCPTDGIASSGQLNWSLLLMEQ